MKIISLTAENIKKLVAIEICPDGNLVQITGKNGQGKTSVLDSIWYALDGASNLPAQPIRKGETTAKIRLDLGEIIVTRKFTTTGSSITVENENGGKFSSPQAMLDSLLGSLTFDPLAFSRMDAKSQFNTLKKFVPSVNFDEIEEDDKADYDKRTELGRQLKEAKIQASKVVIDGKIPEARINIDELTKKMAIASEENSQILIRKNNRAQLTEKEAKLRIEANEIFKKAEAMFAEADAIKEKLAAAPPLPALVDFSELQTKTQEAIAANSRFDLSIQKSQLEERVIILEDEIEQITQNMKEREQNKQDAIATAKLPVPGISFGPKMILLNGVPFDQASDAEQLRTSIAIAMASNPKLKVIRVRDGSLLDEASMKILESMANANDYQVWIERVDSSGKIGFVLEDGQLKQAHTKVPDMTEEI